MLKVRGKGENEGRESTREGEWKGRQEGVDEKGLWLRGVSSHQPVNDRIHREIKERGGEPRQPPGAIRNTLRAA